MIIISSLLIYLFALNGRIQGRRYKREWRDLDSRPLPQWYDQSKIGVLIHWGVYTVPGLQSEQFWWQWKEGDYFITDFMKRNYPSRFTYQDFAPKFTGEFFDPKQWAGIIKTSGAKYVVFTAKFHDGFAMFPSARSFSWNSMDVGLRRDVVGELATAVRAETLIFGIYYSLYEWFNPLYLTDKAKVFTTNSYIVQKMWPDIQQLVRDYMPAIIWADGDHVANETYWKSQDLLAWLYNDSPVKDEVVVNDRWGKTSCKHGGFYNCMDRYNPGVLQNHKWENVFTLDKTSWGHRKHMQISDVMNTTELLETVIKTVSCGGNVLINIGPTQYGTISPIFTERLITLGQWLEINGQAIYGSSPWYHQRDSVNSQVWYTCRTSTYNAQNPVKMPASQSDVLYVYAFILNWPLDNILKLADITKYIDTKTAVTMYGYDPLITTIKKKGITEIKLPLKQLVISKYAYVIEFRIRWDATTLPEPSDSEIYGQF